MGRTTYTYDDAGKTDDTTNRSGDFVLLRSYRERLTGVTIKTSGGAFSDQATYTYDALNRRIGTNVDANEVVAGSPVQTGTTYDRQETHADFNGSETLQAAEAIA